MIAVYHWVGEERAIAPQRTDEESCSYLSLRHDMFRRRYLWMRMAVSKLNSLFPSAGQQMRGLYNRRAVR